MNLIVGLFIFIGYICTFIGGYNFARKEAIDRGYIIYKKKWYSISKRIY